MLNTYRKFLTSNINMTCVYTILSSTRYCKLDFSCLDTLVLLLKFCVKITIVNPTANSKRKEGG